MKVKNINFHSKEMNEINKLYQQVFPQNEQMSLTWLFDEIKKGECLAFYQNHQLCGFTILCQHQDITHILYLAVQPELQNQGIGTYILNYLDKISKHIIIVDIEKENENAKNNKQRQKRKQFYMRNGYIESEVGYHWQSEDYMILCKNGMINRKMFTNFWETLKK